MTANAATGQNNLPHFAKRVKRSLPGRTNGTSSVAKAFNAGTQDLTETSQKKNKLTVNINKRLQNQGTYGASTMPVSQEASQAKLPTSDQL